MVEMEELKENSFNFVSVFYGEPKRTRARQKMNSNLRYYVHKFILVLSRKKNLTAKRNTCCIQNSPSLFLQAEATRTTTMSSADLATLNMPVEISFIKGMNIPDSDIEYSQWLQSMLQVARLPGGLPIEFRRKVIYLTPVLSQHPQSHINPRLVLSLSVHSSFGLRSPNDT